MNGLVHIECTKCKAPMRAVLRHGDSRTCPWCAACANKR